MDRIEEIHEFYATGLKEITNLAFIEQRDWVRPSFLAGLPCPHAYSDSGFSIPFMYDDEFVVLICPEFVLRACHDMNDHDFRDCLDLWLWRLLKRVELWDQLQNLSIAEAEKILDFELEWTKRIK